MRILRLALAFLATALMVVFAAAQPGSTTPPEGKTKAAPVASTPLAAAVLGGIDDPVVIDELKLKDEQLNTLVAHRAAIWDEQYVTPATKFADGAAARADDRRTAPQDAHRRSVQAGDPTGGPEPVPHARRRGGPAAHHYQSGDARSLPRTR